MTSFTTVAALVDTNVLVYRFDGWLPEKQRRSTELLRRGILDDTLQHDRLYGTVRAVNPFRD